jgi:hypothetical protein
MGPAVATSRPSLLPNTDCRLKAFFIMLCVAIQPAVVVFFVLG